jgi:hypothetical protein
MGAGSIPVTITNIKIKTSKIFVSVIIDNRLETGVEAVLEELN